MKEKIDQQNWDRKEVFDFFSSVSDPFYAISFDQDVTEAVAFARTEKLSFYMVMIWLMTKAINQVENFRYTVSGQDVFLCEERLPSFTDLKPGSELFHIVTMQKMEEDIRTFCRAAREKSLQQNCFIDYAAEAGDLIYFSCLPGLNMKSITNEMDRLVPCYKDDTAPRIAWGKRSERDGRVYVTLCMEVNHRFIDGLHITRFSQTLEQLTRALAATGKE